MTGDLETFADDVATQLGTAMERVGPTMRHDDPQRVVPLVALCGAVQLIHAGRHNLRDAERLDQLARLGAEWRVIVRGEIVGQGSVRSAIDQAIERLLPPKT